MNQIEQQINILKGKIVKENLTSFDINSIEQQLNLFNTDVKIPELIKPCLLNDGIIKFSEDQYDKLLLNHKVAADDGRLTKFVPASGAASRMFQKLQTVIKKYENLSFDELKLKSESDKDVHAVIQFLINLKLFAFYDDLISILKVDDEGVKKIISKSPVILLRKVLFEPGLNYSSKPKGAIRFHKYKTKCRTAFEEQIYESLSYVIDKSGIVKIHFTLSEEHLILFKEIIENLRSEIGTEFSAEITTSFQKKSTNTIAVNEKNELLFDEDGNIILRPGGHGALLENLNDLDADIVIIKNIDNLIIEQRSVDTILYKKLLIGYLVQLQKQVFRFIDVIMNNKFDQITFNEIIDFSKEKLLISTPAEFNNWDDETKKDYMLIKLNRPIRVCGMVKNVGEPGGGPFWVKSNNNVLSLQIVEQAQINMSDENQKSIFMQSTHFNPVDLICGLKDYKGNKFDLRKFVDDKSGIITKKSKDGVELKALELPGLWNGSMADWITIFVEVPITTFNPVKEVNDLLRKEHQNVT